MFLIKLGMKGCDYFLDEISQGEAEGNQKVVGGKCPY
jgi:hypothetical protein